MMLRKKARERWRMLARDWYIDNPNISDAEVKQRVKKSVGFIEIIIISLIVRFIVELIKHWLFSAVSVPSLTYQPDEPRFHEK